MALIEWNDSFNVDIEVIDKQHKKLVSMINDFYDQVSNKSSKELIGELIGKMKAYTEDHFRTEENIFKKINYHESEEHIQKHRDFIEKVNDLQSRYGSGKLIISFEITNFLKNWLVSHIQDTDMKYAEIIRRLN